MKLYKALVSGGPKNFVLGKLTRFLNKLNIEIIDHWEWKKMRDRTLPKECDFILSITNMTGHTARNQIKSLLKASEIPLIESTGQIPQLQQALERNNFVQELPVYSDMDVLENLKTLLMGTHNLSNKALLEAYSGRYGVFRLPKRDEIRKAKQLLQRNNDPQKSFWDAFKSRVSVFIVDNPEKSPIQILDLVPGPGKFAENIQQIKLIKNKFINEWYKQPQQSQKEQYKAFCLRIVPECRSSKAFRKLVIEAYGKDPFPTITKEAWNNKLLKSEVEATWKWFSGLTTSLKTEAEEMLLTKQILPPKLVDKVKGKPKRFTTLLYLLSRDIESNQVISLYRKTYGKSLEYYTPVNVKNILVEMYPSVSVSDTIEKVVEQPQLKEITPQPKVVQPQPLVLEVKINHTMAKQITILKKQTERLKRLLQATPKIQPEAKTTFAQVQGILDQGIALTLTPAL